MKTNLYTSSFKRPITNNCKNIALFLVLLVLLDQVIGFAISKAFVRIRSGDKGGSINFALEKKAEILILGSSRARHHYAPKVMSKALGKTVYNAGINGQGLLYAFLLFDLKVIKGTVPSHVILNIDPGSFLGKGTQTRSKIFAHFMDDSKLVYQTMQTLSPFSSLKYLSKTYRYNGMLLPILKNLFINQPNDFNGFLALEGPLQPKHIDHIIKAGPGNVAKNIEVFDATIVKLFHRFLQQCNTLNIDVILVNSPRYNPFISDQDVIEQYMFWQRSIAKLLKHAKDAHFLTVNTFTYPNLFLDASLFKDQSHMNKNGAILFSKILSRELKKIMVAGPQPRLIK